MGVRRTVFAYGGCSVNGKLSEEPVLTATGIAEAIRQIVGFLIVTGVLAWSEQVSVQFMNAVSAVLSIAVAWYARRNSTPNVKVATLKRPNK